MEKWLYLIYISRAHSGCSGEVDYKGAEVGTDFLWEALSAIEARNHRGLNLGGGEKSLGP